MARQQGASPMAQPKFDDEEPQVVTPFKKHVLPSSGSTPLGESSFNHRIHLRMLGGPDFNSQPPARRQSRGGCPDLGAEAPKPPQPFPCTRG